MKIERSLDALLRHIRGVQDNCFILGKHWIEQGNVPFGKELIANGLKHDQSKFVGLEWEVLVLGQNLDRLKEAIRIHNTNPENFHHPESSRWPNGIHSMSNVALAEMVCDCKARSEELGTDIKQWFEGPARKKFGFKDGDKVDQKIKEYLDVLLIKFL